MADPWASVSTEETKADPPKGDWQSAEFTTESSRGSKSSRAPRSRGRPRPRDEASREETKQQPDRDAEETKHQQGKPEPRQESEHHRKGKPRQENKPSNIKDDWSQSEFPDKGPKNTKKPQGEEEHKRPPQGNRGRGGYRRRGRGGRTQSGEAGELATVRRRFGSRRQMITNVHTDEVIYREEDESLDPNSEATSLLRATETWEELGLPEPLIAALFDAGYEYPSKIQKVTIKMFSSIPDLQKLVAQSHTGSGKTAAFAIASLMKVDPAVKSVQVLVFSHTIELSQQIHAEYAKFAAALGVETTLLSRSTTGDSVGQVVVGTDGTIQRLIKSSKFDLARLKVVVLDEADHMLSPEEKRDFYNELKLWRDTKFPPTTIYLLFSATFSDSIIEQIEDLLEDHYEIKIKKEDLVLSNIKQYYFTCTDRDPNQKIEIADKLLKTVALGLTIIFCNTCRFAETLLKKFTEKEYKCALLIGRNMTLNERARTMADFMEGKYTLLITTNLLARGIDNKLVKNIINFDMPVMPKSPEINLELYIHRIGRCGRFGRNGIAITIASTDAEVEGVEAIKNFYSCDIEPLLSIEQLDAIALERERAVKAEDEEAQ